MNSWNPGLCHTYDPPREVPPGGFGQFYALFGNRHTVLDEQRFKGFNIYLHDKGQFWPGLEMDRVGLSNLLFVSKDYEWVGSFSMKQKTLLNKDDSPCELDPTYSFQKCVLSWVSKTSGCHLDWFSPPPSKDKACSTPQDIIRCIQYQFHLTLS